MSSPQESQDRIINKNNDWFGQVPAWIMEYVDRIGPEGFAIYAALCIHANKVKRCFPSYETLAKETGTSKPTVIDRIKKMEILGLIKIISHGSNTGKANLYEIVSFLQPVKPLYSPPVKNEANQSTALTGTSKGRLPEQYQLTDPYITIGQKTFYDTYTSDPHTNLEPISDEDRNRNLQAIQKVKDQLKTKLVLN